MKNEVLKSLINVEVLSISQIYKNLIHKQSISLISVKRLVSKMVDENLLIKTGKGRSVRYKISSIGRLNIEIDIKDYCNTDIDKRIGLDKYNFDLFENMPKSFFTKDEIDQLDFANKK